jgi:hypothetical protein
VRARVAGTVLVTIVGTALGAGCNGSGGDDTSRAAQVYVATIRDVLADEPPPEDPDVLPVVYVVGVGERAIPADVQAEVAVELDDDADIRFADERSEALLEDEDHVPVRDDGLLIAVGELADDVDPVEITVEVYRSDDDWSKVLLTVSRRSSQWTVTSSSLVPLES